jgi:hypothetical protein
MEALKRFPDWSDKPWMGKSKKDQGELCLRHDPDGAVVVTKPWDLLDFLADNTSLHFLESMRDLQLRWLMDVFGIAVTVPAIDRAAGAMRDYYEEVLNKLGRHGLAAPHDGQEREKFILMMNREFHKMFWEVSRKHLTSGEIRLMNEAFVAGKEQELFTDDAIYYKYLAADQEARECFPTVFSQSAVARARMG